MASDARAVRKAVNVAACSRPRGAPAGSKRVIAPVGGMTFFVWCCCGSSSVFVGVEAAAAAAVVRVMTLDGFRVSFLGRWRYNTREKED